MKPSLGPYVAVRDLPGGALGRVSTARATDRLTGMPVLLHALPAPVPLPELPVDAPLLPPTDLLVEQDGAYLVTELPLAAVPATDPLLAARGALAALAALHERGLTHGGVGPAQLWSVDGEVLLAGAGLPWSTPPGTPQEDLRDLARTLEALGGLPEPLRVLRDPTRRLSALEALKLLGSQQSAAVPPAVPPEPHRGVEDALLPVTLHDGSVIVIGAVPEAVAPSAPVDSPSPPPTTDEGQRSSEAQTTDENPLPPVLSSEDVNGLLAALDHPASSDTPAAPVPPMTDAPEEPGAPDADTDAGNGAPETQPTGTLPARRRPRDPVRVGWDEQGNWRLLRDTPPAPPTRLRWLLPLLALLLLGAGAWAAWHFKGGRIPGNAAATGSAPKNTETGTTRPSSTALPSSGPARVRFEVQGRAGVKARVVVLEAPAAAQSGKSNGESTGQGTLLGVVPGTLTFPAPGTYRLKVSAEGYTPARYDLKVPRTKPVIINLGQ